MMSYEKTTLGVSATQGHFRDIMLSRYIRKGSLLLYLRCSVWSTMFTLSRIHTDRTKQVLLGFPPVTQYNVGKVL